MNHYLLARGILSQELPDLFLGGEISEEDTVRGVFTAFNAIRVRDLHRFQRFEKAIGSLDDDVGRPDGHALGPRPRAPRERFSCVKQVSEGPHEHQKQQDGQPAENEAYNEE